MNKSDSIKELALALHKAHTKIKAAVKDSANPFFKSKYADLSSVIEAVKQPLSDNGIVYLQGVEGVEGGVAVETMLLHTSGEWISSKLEIPASKNDAQGYGSAITYGRRYGLQAMCGVPAEDDDGNAATASAKDIGARGRVDPKRRKMIEDTAVLIKDALKEDRDFDAFGYCEPFSTGDPDEKSYLWSFLDPSQRARIKTQSEVAKGGKTEGADYHQRKSNGG
jgi:hypothetical protein